MPEFDFQSKYCKKTKAVAFLGNYANGVTAMRIFAAQDMEPLTTATVNLEEYGEIPSEGNVFIYGDYGEHVGVYDCLLRAGIVGESIRRIDYGGYDGHAYECRLNLEAI